MTVEFENKDLFSELEIKWITEVLMIALDLYTRDGGEAMNKRATELIEGTEVMKSLRELDLQGYNKLMDELSVKRKSSMANHMALVPKIVEKLQKYSQIVHK